MTNPAALTSLVIGALLCLLYGWVAFFPKTAMERLRALPRSIWLGRVLAVICVAWFARNLWQVDLGPFNAWKNLIYVLAPVGMYLVIVYLPDLLAVRGLCVLALLAGQPVLIATRWTGTPASWAVGILVYVVLLKSMVLVVYPHLWIRGINRWEQNPALQKTGLILGNMVGLAMLVCGAISFT